MSVRSTALLASRSEMARTLRILTRTKQTQEKAIVDLIVDFRACPVDDRSLAGLHLVSLRHSTRQLGRLSRLLNGIVLPIKRVAGCAVEPQRSQRRWTAMCECGQGMLDARSRDDYNNTIPVPPLRWMCPCLTRVGRRMASG